MHKNDKPNGARLGWRLVETTYPLTTPWLKMRQDHVQVEGKGEITYTYRESSSAVIIVPVTDDGKLILIRHYRYALDDWCLEVPAGGTHDQEGVPLEKVALEELREEIGAVCRDLKHVNFVYTATPITDEETHIFLALGTEIVEQQRPEDLELIEVYPVAASEALELARTGQIKSCLSALSVLMCEGLLREHGYL